METTEPVQMETLRYPTAREISDQALAHGPASLGDMPVKPTRKAVQKACDHLRDLKRGDLADEVERLWVIFRKRGRKKLQKGDDRVFRAQQSGGMIFYRIPAYLIGVHKKGVPAVVHAHVSGKGATLTPTHHLGPDDEIEKMG